MRRLFHFFAISLMFFFAASLDGFADEIQLVQGILPPYAMPESDSGIEVDIIRAALAKRNHSVDIRYVPFGRVALDFSRSESDAGSPLNPRSGIIAEYSDSHLVYENVAVSLRENRLKIENIKSLSKYRIAAFMDAKIFLGSEFAAMAVGNTGYREVGNQINQNRLLRRKRVDVTIGDFRIFQYYDKQLAKEQSLKQVEFHHIFDPTPYHVAFKDEKLKDDFNMGLQEIRASGEYQIIISNYTTGPQIN
ncbi:transporter substrate-binding domain-containing protein [Sneathiella sp. P13V-1]|uniref:substrate-binding periplasmic protein n=1 Tax=Sneathiella sp. P13V-1 TaxID=2697366 RepID=UPI00187B256C|nr:transporter substrate-binding domain-containing protein [Sneathiella sp. P13V-1]MBE7637928.1 transporter substrate-binding domain-containing protein [Sneathiella sp. P13V-1]